MTLLLLRPRDAIGATLYLDANGIRQREDVMSGGSYLSSNDQRAHFGLGSGTDAGTLEIHWPSGKVEKIKLPATDRIYTIAEGKGITPTSDSRAAESRNATQPQSSAAIVSQERR